MRLNKPWIAAVTAVVVLGGAGAYYFFPKTKAKSAASAVTETTVTVTKGNIRSTISGTSQFEAKDQQNIIAPADGTIKTMNLTRNQAVKKSDVLFVISDPTKETSLQEAQNSLDQMQKDLADLQDQKAHMTFFAPTEGKLTLSNNIDVGSNVSKNAKIGTISDYKHLKVTLPFPLDSAVQLKPGDTVDLSVDGFKLSKSASVRSVDTTAKADSDGSKLVDVELAVDNDGTLDAGVKVKGSFSVNGLKVESRSQAALDYTTVANIMSGASGSIKQLNFKTGDMVPNGAVLAVMGSDTLPNDIVNKQSQIERQRNTVADLTNKVNELTVVAPFDGVFSTDFANKKANVLASYPVGSKITANTQLGAVASTDSMQLPIQVDELDLPQIKMGMKADIKVDAIQGKTFQGEVSQVSTVGTTTNGVTAYDVVLSVKDTSQLKYGMTATADILIQDKRDVLQLPIQALQSQRGNYSVTLLKPDGTREDNHAVKIGVRSKTNAEITEGLNEGDKVIVKSRSTQQSLSQQELDRLRQQMQGGQGFPGGFQGGQGGFQGGGNFQGGGGSVQIQRSSGGGRGN
ncbi:efflux RND transporter periplasmic adaptor subunit [Paenibacillus filicis]|uniref:Efflux RND transporter periplasmic adaptor subunit n=1 Tax=Paenibacillus gyeongsangnamensis TaxID=3388067 RepID=A0ABT4QJV3_9BACL|nr:efflux RND transporter periplasmic adaptor subunit [Paenibacillus filicis]MCZ8517156.1 efflux RND transporter periplasmic adaptor subunit [Paenibacillus filicis]